MEPPFRGVPGPTPRCHQNMGIRSKRAGEISDGGDHQQNPPTLLDSFVSLNSCQMLEKARYREALTS